VLSTSRTRRTPSLRHYNASLLLAGVSITVLLLLAGCGGGGKTTTVTVTTPAATSATGTTAVPFVEGLPESLAVAKITATGLKVTVRRVHESQPIGIVTTQVPAAGSRVAKGTVVRIKVSTGK
jgi:beta-lactam-binding protein with PASTA domain